MRTGARLKRQNRYLRRLFYLLQRLEASVYLEFVPRDLNLADCLSGIDSDRDGSVVSVSLGARVCYKALEAYRDLSSPGWVLEFPKGRCGAAANLGDSPLGSEQSHLGFPVD